MNSSPSETLPIQSENDIVLVRKAVRKQATILRFGTVDLTKLVTAASELARNALKYGKGGHVNIDLLDVAGRAGIRLEFVDQGPGIADINQAMTDGFTTGGGMGLGLSGSRRLVNEFQIHSEVGKGTTVTITQWKGR